MRPKGLLQRSASSAEGGALQVVVDAIDPGCLVSDCNSKLFDFGSATSAELENIVIPLRLQAGAPRHACDQAWVSLLPGNAVLQGEGSGRKLHVQYAALRRRW